MESQWNLKFAFQVWKVMEMGKICLGHGKVMEFQIFHELVFS